MNIANTDYFSSIYGLADWSHSLGPFLRLHWHDCINVISWHREQVQGTWLARLWATFAGPIDQISHMSKCSKGRRGRPCFALVVHFFLMLKKIQMSYLPIHPGRRSWLLPTFDNYENNIT